MKPSEGLRLEVAAGDWTIIAEPARKVGNGPPDAWDVFARHARTENRIPLGRNPHDSPERELRRFFDLIGWPRAQFVVRAYRGGQLVISLDGRF